MSLRGEFGRNFRTLRKTLGLTQEGLADRSGVHATTIGRIERGKANLRLETLDALARGLKLPLWDLVYYAATGGTALPSTPRPDGARSDRTLSVAEPADPASYASGKRPLQFIAVFEPARGGYTARVPDLPGCSASAPTPDAAEASVQRAAIAHVRALRGAARPIPLPAAYATVIDFDPSAGGT